MQTRISQLSPNQIGQWMTKCPKTNHAVRGSDTAHMYLPKKSAMWWECPECSTWHVFFCQTQPLANALEKVEVSSQIAPGFDRHR